MSHYETLGVERNATPEAIKAGYRKAASAAHPDREGGSAERMQAVNQAYECLSDPERRERYDQTGNDAPQDSLQGAAEQMLAHVFNQVLDMDPPDFLAVVREALADMKRRTANAKATAMGKLDRLRKMQGKVRTKDGAVNMVEGIINGRIQAAQRDQELAERGLELHAEAMRLLEAYECDARPPGKKAARSATDILNDEMLRVFGGNMPYYHGRRRF